MMCLPATFVWLMVGVGDDVTKVNQVEDLIVVQTKTEIFLLEGNEEKDELCLITRLEKDNE